MSLSFLTPQRTVLLVSDEALYIYTLDSKGVKLIEAVPWEAENFEQDAADILTKECGKRPVLVLNDMVEQHYRKERVIKRGVSFLDKQNLIKRKLNAAFPNFPVRAAYPLKEKVPKSESSLPAEVHIFAAIPSSDQFTKTLASSRESLVSMAGFCLLPVEASDMIKAMSLKLAKDKKNTPVWAVFMGQHKSGGLRQIVVKNGELALTRMTPIVENDDNPQNWAEEVHQEFKATMSYLLRFGYRPEDGLQVITIANEASGEALHNLIEEECSFNAFTLPQAANLLDLQVGPHEEEGFADPLHVAWTGRKSKFILPMKAVQLDEVSKPRQAAMAASLLLFLGAAFLSYQLLDSFQKLTIVKDDIENSQNRNAQLQAQYQREVQRKEELGFDVRLVQSSIAVKKAFEAHDIDVLPFFSKLGHALGKDMRVDKITITKSEPGFLSNLVNAVPLYTSQGEEKKADPLYDVKMQMTYPSTTDIDKGNQEVRDLRDRLQQIMPDHETKVTKFLKDYEYVEELVVETGDVDTRDVQQDFVAEITVTGPPPKMEDASL